MKNHLLSFAQTLARFLQTTIKVLRKNIKKPTYPSFSHSKAMKLISSLLTLQAIILYAVHIIATPALNQGLNRYKEATGRIALNLFGSDRSTQNMLLELQTLLQFVWFGAIILTLVSLWTWVFPQQFIRLAQRIKIL